ncbi:MAG: hypothetical protein BWY09_01641 [Candidatus Hydrogenedentes bacterium ADurb.Bin179]|nr:MAG: hypothetical protein BWY09_01641 [Candidatus Hydrogenedentes bacterium ADurb.Bin179]
MRTIFDLCTPRDDVLAGRVKDEEFAADLAAVVNGKATKEYADSALFFKYTYPTRGLKTLLETVCRRLSGKGGELNSVVRLDTQYGGGKTHSLIALVHAVRGMQDVAGAKEFIDPKLLPKGNIRVAAIDGENADPANGLKLEKGLMARSIWGEMAYRLAGREGYERVRKSDEAHVAPGTETIVELFGGEPTLILIDEVSVYLRKVAQVFPDAVNQFPAFMQALIKAVSSTPQTALVCTLAVRAADEEARDAYKAEQQLALAAFAEAESIVSRKLLQLDPTEEDETVDVLRRRLFEEVNIKGAAKVIEEYTDLWDRNKESLAPDAFSPETRDQFRKGYPLHPETLNVMTEKMSSLSTFQRTRGMLRLLARTVYCLWKDKPADAYSIHPHHIDLGNPQIRAEITTRLGQGAYASALGADVASVAGKDPSIAQRLDQTNYAGQPPVTSYVASTIFLNTMAFGESAQGITPDHLRYSVCSPAVEPSFVEAARKQFAGESLYLDDRPGAPMRFRVEPNLTQIINREMREIDADEIRNILNTRIKDLFSSGKSDFVLIPFPAGPYEIPDDIGDGRPYLVVLNYDAFALSDTPAELPQELVRMATKKGVKEEIRTLQNNLIFVVADKRLTLDMKQSVRRRLALEAIVNSAKINELADYQQRKVREEYEKSRSTVAIATLQCYRHLFYPSNVPIGSGEARLGHTTIELQNASDSPGNGQQHIKRALRDQKKLLASGDEPDAPSYVRDQTPLKTKGQITTLELRNEFRRAPNLSILLDDDPLIRCIQLGIAHDVFIYREGDLVWGKGDPSPAIQISVNAFVHTLANAKELKLWPRPPKELPKVQETPGEDGGDGVSGGTGGSGGGGKGPAPQPPKPSASLSAEGPLRQALVELFDKARSQKVDYLKSITMRFYEAKGAWSAHQAVATYRDMEATCRLSVGIEGEGIESFDVQFSGTLSKANSIKSFLEPQLRSATNATFEADYMLTFATPFATVKEKTDGFITAMTKYGGAEAYVEAAAGRAEGRG